MLAAKTSSTGFSLSVSQRIATALFAGFLGLSLLYVTGFAAETHNAAHDTRHALVFPCH